MSPDRLDILPARPLLFSDAPRARRFPASVVLVRPEAAPQWAVVVSGAGPDAAAALAALAAHGFAAVAADPPPGWPGPTEATRLTHAFAALAALAALSDMPGRVVHLGVGAGGAAAVLSAYAQVGRLFAAGAERFAAHVAIGGAPTFRLEDYRTTGAPLALAGIPTDPERRRLVADDLREGGSVVAEIPADNAPPADRRRLRLTPENDLVDERTGRLLRGPLGRLRVALGAPATGTATPERLGAILAVALSNLPPRQEHP